jgi:Tfp pilus assembly protein PilO
MKAANINKGSLIVIVPVAAVVAAYVLWVYLPGKRAIADLREQIRTKQDYVLESEKLTKALREGKQELTRTETYVAACRRRASEEKDLGNILGLIHESANKARVRITRFDPQPPTSYERLRRVPVVVGLVGQFEQIHVFLRSLEGMPTYIWIGSVKMDVDTKSGKDIVGEIKFDVFVGNSDGSGYTVCSD